MMVTVDSYGAECAADATNTCECCAVTVLPLIVAVIFLPLVSVVLLVFL